MTTHPPECPRIAEALNERMETRNQQWLADEIGCCRQTVSRMLAGHAVKSVYVERAMKRLGLRLSEFINADVDRA